jgi:hypothetical protein
MSAITSSVLYAVQDAKIAFHGKESFRQEILITNMEISGYDGSEERIAALEKKVQNMEPLVKGLVAELLDFKAVAMAMSREAEELSRHELRQGPAVYAAASPSPGIPAISISDGSTIIRPRGAHPSSAPAAPAEPEMVLIMQTDGTMKLEPRYGGNLDSASVGYGRTKKGTFAQGKQAPLIYAADEKKSDAAKK